MLIESQERANIQNEIVRRERGGRRGGRAIEETFGQADGGELRVPETRGERGRDRSRGRAGSETRAERRLQANGGVRDPRRTESGGRRGQRPEPNGGGGLGFSRAQRG